MHNERVVEIRYTQTQSNIDSQKEQQPSWLKFNMLYIWMGDLVAGTLVYPFGHDYQGRLAGQSA